MDNNSVKNNIVRLRKSRNISQVEMARRLEMSRNAYRNIETGKTKLLSDSLVKIAGILSVAPEILLENTYQENTLTDVAVKYNEAIETLKESHSEEFNRMTEEIKRLKDEISSMSEYISALRELISTKDEIISMLKKLDSQDANS